MQTKPNGEYFLFQRERRATSWVLLFFPLKKVNKNIWLDNQTQTNKPNKNAIEILISKKTMFKKNINYLS